MNEYICYLQFNQQICSVRLMQVGTAIICTQRVQSHFPFAIADGDKMALIRSSKYQVFFAGILRSKNDM